MNEAVVATYLAGGNTRRIRSALQPLLKDGPLSKSAVSRVVATLKDGLQVWRTRSRADVDADYLDRDAFALRVRGTLRRALRNPLAGEHAHRHAQKRGRPTTGRSLWPGRPRNAGAPRGRRSLTPATASATLAPPRLPRTWRRP